MAHTQNPGYVLFLCIGLSLVMGALTDDCCTDGETKVDEDDCSKYYICCTGQFVHKSCKVGFYWNQNYCVEDKGECNGNNSTCTEGAVKVNPSDCAAYLECVDREFISISCPSGMFFNTTLQRCAQDTQFVCLDCTEGCTREDLNDCTKYEICTQGKYVSKSCLNGQWWNPDSRSCEVDNGECNGDNSTCIEGTLKVDPTNCAGYLQCVGGKYVAKVCGPGDFFDKTQGECTEDISGVCVNCVEGTTKWDKNDCASYFNCTNGKFVSITCPKGEYWNVNLTKCDEDNGECNGDNSTCIEGTLKVDPTNCAGYLQCVGGRYVTKVCGPGDFFNKTQGECIEDTAGVCVNCVEGTTKRDENDCASYFNCTNGKFVSKTCPKGEYWNVDLRDCDEDTGQCNGDNSTCTEGTVKVDPTNCAGYLQCVGGVYVAKVCGPGLFFNKTQAECTLDWTGACLDCAEGSKEEDKGDCSKYLLCQGGKYSTMSCPNEQYWNTTLGECLDDNGECKGNATCTEGATEANPANCAGYLECINGKLVSRLCGDLMYFNVDSNRCELDTNNECLNKTCDPECCDKLDNWMGSVPNNCSAFLQCVGGFGNIQVCPNNLQFNNKTKMCDFPGNVQCDDGSAPPSGPAAGPSGTYCESHGVCVGQPDGKKFTDATNRCSGKYVVCQCECEINMACSNGLVFDEKYLACNYPANAGC